MIYEGINLYNSAKNTVFFIYNLNDEKEFSPIGTGFFLQLLKESNTEKAVGYMVTAKHVLMDQNDKLIDKFFIRLKSKNNIPQSVLIDLTNEIFFLHKDKDVDLIVIPNYPSFESYNYKFVNGEFMLTEKLLGFEEGAEVFFPGLFVQYPGEGEIQPILRFGRVSMIPREKISIEVNGKLRNSHFYLMECTSFGGNSGSPVFFKSNLRQESKTYLAGLITGSYHQTEILPYNTILKQNTGIALVTPSSKLLDILNSKPAYKARQNVPD